MSENRAVTASGDHAEEVPPHHRLLRRGLLGAVWLFTMANVAVLLSIVAIALWQLITGRPAQSVYESVRGPSAPHLGQ
ncbi:MAG: hypothetical protein GEU94_00760 [Micromonosporaceae bacterium]|nr:hypothetical protein [Micromonosporaceae bacterium]